MQYDSSFALRVDSNDNSNGNSNDKSNDKSNDEGRSISLVDIIFNNIELTQFLSLEFIRHHCADLIADFFKAEPSTEIRSFD